MTPPAIRVEAVAKRYGSGAAAIDALRGISFDVPAGQFVSVRGASGCGKSTLLHVIAGFSRPTSGRVVIEDHDLSALSGDALSDLRLRHVGFVFQDSNLLPTFTVLENVAVPLEFLGVSWREATRRAHDVLEAVHVPRQVHARRPAEISGGERQRVAIARALVVEPRILLADEPTGNLDSATGRAILDLLAEMNHTRSVTIVMVTHSTFGGIYGHRTIEMHDGRVVHDIAGPKPVALRSVARDAP